MAEKEDNLHGPKIECEECGSEDVEIINTTYPKGYECKCKKCKHVFTWIAPGEE